MPIQKYDRVHQRGHVLDQSVLLLQEILKAIFLMMHGPLDKRVNLLHGIVVCFQIVELEILIVLHLLGLEIHQVILCLQDHGSVPINLLFVLVDPLNKLNKLRREVGREISSIRNWTLGV